MTDPINSNAPVQNADETRKAWSAPVIEDADISAITHGGGDSGIEGTSFLKPGS